MSDAQHKERSQKMTERSRALRHDSPVPERILWSVLRNRRLGGLKFRREFPVPRHVVDYCCPERQLSVELDGETHVGRADRDEARTRCLRGLGYRVVRVTNDDVLKYLEAVADFILRAAQAEVAGDSADSCVPSPGSLRSEPPSPGRG
jgi:very-short-patch-repair endonuclease